MISERIESMRCYAGRLALATGLLGLLHDGAAAERLRLVCPEAAAGAVRTSVMRPVDVYLVAERDSLHTEISAVAYTLDVPDGLLIVGEELLVESLFGLGSSTAGMNLVFHCASGASMRVLRFRLVATRPVADAVLGLRPDTRTRWLGLVACREEEFARFESPADSVLFSTR